MRFFVFLLMLSICLVAWECAATTGEEGDSQERTDQQQDAGSVDTTKAPEQPKPQIQPQPQLQQPNQQPEPKPQTEAPADDAADRDNTNPGKLQVTISQPGHQSPGQPPQQQQQQQQQQHTPPQGSTPAQGQNGKTSQPEDNAPPAKTPEEVSQTAQDLAQTTNTADGARQEKPLATEEVPAENPASSTSLPTNNAVSRNATTTENKLTDSTQTSLPSTAEPDKGELSAPTTSLPKTSKAIQSLDKKDSTIGTSSLFCLSALVTFVVMAV